MHTQLPSVWFFQPSIQHYRVPVWDRLRAQASGRYDMRVYGPLDGDKAFGGEARDYFHAFPYEELRTLGVSNSRWPGLRAVLAQGRPHVVIMTANIRNRDCWSVPAWARRQGMAVVGWSKVHSFSRFPAWALQMAKRRMFRNFDRCLAYGQLSRAELLALGYPDARIDVAQNTIDTTRIFTHGDEYRARGAALRQQHGLVGKTVILCMARLDPEKRQMDLLEAWPQLRARLPEAYLVLAGGGPLLEQMRTAAQRDSQHILVTGRVPEGDDYAWIATADVSVQPGAVGLAINQSMAFGVPTVIADEIGADTEIVEHGVTGWRFPRGNLAALTNTLVQVLTQPDERQRITSAARTLMQQQVTIDNMVQVMDRCITQALEVCRRRRGGA